MHRFFNCNKDVEDRTGAVFYRALSGNVRELLEVSCEDVQVQKFPNWAKGFVFTILAIGLILIAMGEAIIMKIGGNREQVDRVGADLRTIATALETYYVYNGTYPTHYRKGMVSIIPVALTTPMAYLSSLREDPFSDEVSIYRYLTNGSAYVIFSQGPDKTIEIGPKDLRRGEPALLLKEYNPTNGSISSGDIYRFNGNDDRT